MLRAALETVFARLYKTGNERIRVFINRIFFASNIRDATMRKEKEGEREKRGSKTNLSKLYIAYDDSRYNNVARTTSRNVSNRSSSYLLPIAPPSVHIFSFPFSGKPKTASTIESCYGLSIRSCYNDRVVYLIEEIKI